MINSLIAFSIRNKLIVALGALGILIWGLMSIRSIPLDAVPDITNNQIQVITRAPALAAQDVEQIVTFPIEMQLANLPDVVEMRSISRFGLSVISIVFEEDVDPYLGRQMIAEQLQIVDQELPKGVDPPELAPLTSGLGEVFQYVLVKEEGFEDVYSDMNLRTMHDWIVRRQLMGTPGVIEVSGWGGHLKQYEAQVNTSKLHAFGVSIADVYRALDENNNNAGGSYIEKRFKTYFIRTEGRVGSIEDIENIAVKSVDGIPVLIRDVATVRLGSAPRYGAITYNAEGEVVGGQALMLKGADSYAVVHAIKEKIPNIQESLPEGVKLVPYLDRSELIDRAIDTVRKNLLEGGIIVILILVLLLGNFRGGLIVASVIPLSMAFALGMMNVFGVSANLMSLGAIDFGLIVDGAVIITEAIVFHIYTKYQGQTLSQPRMDEIVFESASKIRSSAAFGEIIILIVYLPLLALSGIEGKMFKPMAQTVSFAILGALILSITYVPMMAAFFLKKKVTEESKVSERITAGLRKLYRPLLERSIAAPKKVLVIAVVIFGVSWAGFTQLGGEFVPTLEEGDLALHQILPPGSSLNQSVEVSAKIQRVLLDNFPEVELVVSKIGSSEVPTDPMPIEVGDIIVKLKPKDQWVSASSKEELFEVMEAKLITIPGINYEFTQPIQMRFNELMSGVREDIAIMLFGENLEVLADRAKAIESAISGIDGVGDVRVEQTTGQQQMVVEYKREKMAQYGVTVDELNRIIESGFAGGKAGVVYENERKFDLVVRLSESSRGSISDLQNLLIPIRNSSHTQVPLSVLANIEMKEGPMQISRQSAKRKIAIGVNARNRDIQSLVEEIQSTIKDKVELPDGYSVYYGGKFENMVQAQRRLAVAVPAALLLILSLLYVTFRSMKSALLIFSAIPLAAIGGVWSLYLRDMPFSISAGIGFIALFGVAVLNGIVLIAKFEELRDDRMEMDDVLKVGSLERLRPVIMTALVAALGFLPMALSTSAGAEVQRPLATVVIGGLISSTLLTLVVLPALYKLFNRPMKGLKFKSVLVFIPLLIASQAQAQNDSLTLERTISMAKEYHPSMREAGYQIEAQKQMKRTGIDLGRTKFAWSYGQMNTAAMDNRFRVAQDFNFLFNSRRNVEYRKAMVDIVELEGALVSEELEFAVKNDYFQLAFLMQIFELQTELKDEYEQIVRSARLMQEVGETGSIDRIAAESRLARVELMLTQIESEIQLARIHLEEWVGSFDPELMPTDAMQTPLALTLEEDTLLLEIERQRVQAMESKWRVMRNEFAPHLELAYWQQQIDGEGGFNGIGAGISIPLFFWAQDGRSRAAKAQYMAQQEHFRAYEAEYKQSLRSAQEEVWRYERMMDWFHSEGLRTASALEKASVQSYAIGEIGYMEYFAGIEEAWKMRADYLEVQRDYQVALSYYQFLRGDSKK